MESFYGLKMLSAKGIEKMSEIGLMPFFFILLSSLIVSLFISHLYIRFYGTKGSGSTLHRAFPLLGVSITAIFVALQFSIPLSLGLLGALSIVRFRTPIKDPEEVGFILLVIAASLCCATFNMPFLGLLMVVAVGGMVVLKFDKKIFRKRENEGMLIVKMPEHIYSVKHQELISSIKGALGYSKVDSILEDANSCTLTYTFGKLSDEEAGKLRSGLKAISNEISLNVFYSHVEG